MSDTNIRTYIDLYNFLRDYSNTNDNIYDWLNINWLGKDKQESLLRLFGFMGLIKKLDNFYLAKGNFNLATIYPIKNMKDIFIDNTNSMIYLKDKGDSSDLSGFNKYRNNNVLGTTSKNLDLLNINKLDIEKLEFNFSKIFKDAKYSLTLCIVIKSIDEFNLMLTRTNITNKHLLNYIKTSDLILIDHNDLNEAFKLFKYNYWYNNITIKNILNYNSPALVFKMHQKYTI